MTRDYAKPQKATHNKNTKAPLRLITLVIAMIAIIAIGFGFFHYRHLTANDHKIVTAKNPAPTVVKAHTTPTIKKSATGQFDFYSMLPKMKVNVAKPTLAGAMPIPEGNQPYFILQIATSTNEQSAQLFASKLGVIGLSAYVQPIKRANGSSYYRIVTGPYLSQAALKDDRELLNVNHYQNLLIAVHNKP